MRTFDYSFLKTDKISNDVLALFISIEKFQGSKALNEELYPKVFENLKSISRIQSIKTSNLMDDIVSSDKRIEFLSSKSTQPINFDEECIIGYGDVLSEIVDNYDSYQLREYTIRDFHKTLNQHTDANYGGTYKKEDNLIMHTLDDGTNSVIFRPISVEETNSAMEQLVLAYKTARDDSSIPNLLLIPCVILDFLCIYPFSEGNERMSRLLSSFLLYKNGYDVGKVVSFEKQINNSKFEFYEALRLSSINWDNNSNDYNPFMENFLSSLYMCHRELKSRFNILESGKTSKKDRIEITIKKSGIPISRQEIYQIWPDISHETIKKVIKNLLNENKIMKIGNFKDARYKRNWYGKTTQNDENMVIF